jgi:hypothetical protein
VTFETYIKNEYGELNSKTIKKFEKDLGKRLGEKLIGAIAEAKEFKFRLPRYTRYFSMHSFADRQFQVEVSITPKFINSKFKDVEALGYTAMQEVQGYSPDRIFLPKDIKPK